MIALRRSGVTFFTSEPPEITWFRQPLQIEENYWLVGRAEHYAFPQRNKFAPTPEFEPLRKFSTGEYGLSHVDNIEEITRSHAKYAEPCRKRNVEFIESFDENPLLDSIMWAIYGFALTTDTTPDVTVVDIQNLSKGAGTACSSIKRACWEKGAWKLIKLLDDPSPMRGEIPIWQGSGKLEIRLKTKPCRIYVIAPMWFSMGGQKFTKLQNESLMAHRFKIPSAVGMSVPYEWPRLHRALHEHARPGFKTLYFLSDISLWDAVQHRSCLWRLFRLRARGLGLVKGTPEYAQFEHQVYWTINRIVLLPDASVVFTKDGNASGKVDTTHDNGMNQVQMVAMCWHYLKGNFIGFVQFIRRSGFFTFGDDVVASIVCKEDLSFFERLPELWLSLFGGTLKSEIVSEWSDVHFLGQRPISNFYPGCFLVRPYDTDRQVSNLVEKGNPVNKPDPIRDLQRALAHRMLLAATYLTDDHDVLDALKVCIADLVNRYDPLLIDDPLWAQLKSQALKDDDEFALSILTPPIDDNRVVQCAINVSTHRIKNTGLPVAMPQTYVEWTAAHTAKLAGLSKAEKKQRYQNYLGSTGSSKGGVGKVKKSLPREGNSLIQNSGSGNSVSSGVGGPSKRTYSMPALSNATAAYGMSLMNPWDDSCNAAKVVSPIDEDSGVINSKLILTAGAPYTPDPSDANVAYSKTGSGGFIGRPGGLFMSYLYTPGSQPLGFAYPEGGDSSESPGLVVSSPAGGGDTYFGINVGYGGYANLSTNPQFVYPNTNPEFCAWNTLPDAQQIQGLSSKKRVVSAGVIGKYIGPPITGSGMVGVGLVPWEMFVETEFTMNDTGSKAFLFSMPWSKFITLEGVKVMPAMEGFHLSWVPYDSSGTNYQASIATYLNSEQLIYPPPPLSKDGKRPIGTATSTRIHPNASQVRQSLVNGIKVPARPPHPNVRSFDSKTDAPGIARDLALASALGSKKSPTAPTKVGAPVNSFGPYMEYVGVSNSVPFPIDTDQDLLQSVATSVALSADMLNQAIAAGTVDLEYVDRMCVTVMETNPCPGHPLMCVFWNGVAPSNQDGLDPQWAANLFELEYYVNHEVIPDQSTFRIAQQPATPAMVGTPGPAIQAAKALAPAGKGSPPKKESMWSKFKAWVPGAISTGKKVAGYIGKAAQIAETIGDVAAAFF